MVLVHIAALTPPWHEVLDLGAELIAQEERS